MVTMNNLSPNVNIILQTIVSIGERAVTKGRVEDDILNAPFYVCPFSQMCLVQTHGHRKKNLLYSTYNIAHAWPREFTEQLFRTSRKGIYKVDSSCSLTNRVIP